MEMRGWVIFSLRLLNRQPVQKIFLKIIKFFPQKQHLLPTPISENGNSMYQLFKTKLGDIHDSVHFPTHNHFRITIYPLPLKFPLSPCPSIFTFLSLIRPQLFLIYITAISSQSVSLSLGSAPFYQYENSTVSVILKKTILIMVLCCFKLFNESYCSQKNINHSPGLFCLSSFTLQHLHIIIYTHILIPKINFFFSSSNKPCFVYCKYHRCCLSTDFSFLTSVLPHHLQ